MVNFIIFLAVLILVPVCLISAYNATEDSNHGFYKDSDYEGNKRDNVSSNRYNQRLKPRSSSGSIFSSSKSSTSFTTDDVYAEENYEYKSKNLSDKIERESWLDELDRNEYDVKSNCLIDARHRECGSLL